MSRDVDGRKTIFSDTFGGVGRKVMSVNEEGVRMIAAKMATCGDLSTSLSALLAQAILTKKLTSISFLTHRMTETTVCVIYYSIIRFACFVEFRDGTTVLVVLWYVPIVSRRAAERG